MKYFKYLIGFLMLCTIAVCMGEFYQIHIGDYAFPSYFSLSYVSASERQTCAAFLCDMATENNVHIWCTDQQIDRNFAKNNLILYCSDEQTSALIEKNSGIRCGKSKSIFLSDGNVESRDLHDLPNSVGANSYFSMLCAPEDGQRFIDAVESRYRVEFYSLKSPNEGFYSSMAFTIQLALWLTTYAIFFGISLYDVKLMQKELAVRYSLGEKKSRLFAQKALLDCAYFTACFLIAFFGASGFTESLFSFKLSVLFFVGFLLLNILVDSLIFRVNIQKAFSGRIASKSLLSASYTLKLLTCVLLIVVLGVGAGQFSRLVELKQEDDFLRNYKDYSFIDTMALEQDPNLTDQRSAILYFLQQKYFANTLLQSNSFDFGKLSDKQEHCGIVCNKNSTAYLQGLIPELQGKTLEEKMYVLVPQYPGYENDLAKIVDWAQPDLSGKFGYVFCHDYDIEVIPYAQDVRMVAFSKNDDASRTAIYKNPVIYLSCLDESKLQVEMPIGTAEHTYENGAVYTLNHGGLSPATYTQDLLFCISQEELEAFEQEYHFECALLNMYDNYQCSVARAEKVALMTGVLSMVFLLMEACLIGTVVKLEYSINAKKLAVKKILGYNLFEKNKKIILLTLLVIAAGFIGAIVVCLGLRITTAVWFLLLGGIVLSVIELLIVVYNIVRTEKSEVVRILKGDSL